MGGWELVATGIGPNGLVHKYVDRSTLKAIDGKIRILNYTNGSTTSQAFSAKAYTEFDCKKRKFKRSTCGFL